MLLERLLTDAPYLPFDLLRDVVTSGRPAVLATVIGINGHTRANIAERIALDCNGQLRMESTALGKLAQLPEDLDRVLEQRRTAVHRYRYDDGEIEVLIEFIPPPRRLVIFGAGHDATPLMLIAKMQGWRVTIIDSRSHFARPERFPEADQVLTVAINPDAIDADAPDLPTLTDGAAVAIMTHSFSQDLFWLHRVLNGPAAYIGQLGPRNRTERLLAHIQETTPLLPGLARLHYPMGLDIGGDGPEAVALAVLAEMTAVLNERSGQMLKWRERPIHDSELRITASS
ncbi:XdhC family protein [Pseudomonas sp. GM60]|uniref:XdhC family protein n=1 Tax=Pseudomonas sp. GM60 TaxID=1144334 RepID=UPI0002706D75|nr:XdhC family protein [Pseudomonas sp. GM60]EJM88424.1 xanthine and CO dehydrogenases maturation factor, XdhC/CoxF family [Pseudomonas sp. GM60]